MTSNISSPFSLNGLILSGGKSSRMGKDKALLSYHGLPQLDHLTNLLKPFCDQVFVSTKQKDDYPNYQVIEDQYHIDSPLNGILSAIIKYPSNGWIVVACDMPLLNEKSIQYLIDHRSAKKLATCYTNEDNLIEPLFSIWEPNSYEILLKFQLSGGMSPRKFLAANDVNLVKPLDYSSLLNVNTMEEYKNIRSNE